MVAVGDFDDDGRIDLVVIEEDTDDVLLLLQDPAAPGTLLPPRTTDVNGFPLSLTAADVDGDLKTDLVVTRDDGFAQLLVQDAQSAGGFRKLPMVGIRGFTTQLHDLLPPGEFTHTAYQWQLRTEVYVEPETVTIADFNNDGINDGINDIGVTGDSRDLWIWTQRDDAPGRFKRGIRISLPD